MKLEERGFMRHLMLEGKYDEVLSYLENEFPEILEKDKRIRVSINCLKLVTILQCGNLFDAIEFGKTHLVESGHISMPAIDQEGKY
mmetsp:Transcript_5239/g.6228  ORF Transcript_5239/g.6228 Transcript_5239/m.6228 type:complete len:86 (-) Transcript_5239:274-531(-)